MATSQPCATAIPTARQLEFQDWEFGLFLHFGIRTFYEGHRDWDGKPMSASAFNPARLDCGQWARTARQAGMKYAVMTAKHHDGFANWPSKYTDFSVANSPWKNGKGDAVREYVDAFRGEGLAVGLYYSPAQWQGSTFADPKAYDEYFINQVSEILTGYGKIDMLWFDGCGSENHTYDWPRIMREVRRMQPDILIFNMGDPDYRWVGNEAGVAPSPCWNTVGEVAFSVQTVEKEAVAKPVWLPAECDCRMRLANWFYSDDDLDTVKSAAELMGLYYYSVGRGCNLLINIGPDRRGLLPDLDTARLLEFGQEIRRRLAAPLASIGDFKQAGNAWEYEPATAILLDHVVIQENLQAGEHVRGFVVQVFPIHYGDPITVFEGHSIGHKAICSFPPITARKVRVELTQVEGNAKIKAIDLHCAAKRKNE
jgi:alpha-L-fucosidase